RPGRDPRGTGCGGGLRRTPDGFGLPRACGTEETVPRPDELIEGLAVAPRIGMSALPDLAVKRPNHLMAVGASRDAEHLVRIATVAHTEVSPHGPAAGRPRARRPLVCGPRRRSRPATVARGPSPSGAAV